MSASFYGRGLTQIHVDLTRLHQRTGDHRDVHVAIYRHRYPCHMNTSGFDGYSVPLSILYNERLTYDHVRLFALSNWCQ